MTAGARFIPSAFFTCGACGGSRSSGALRKARADEIAKDEIGKRTPRATALRQSSRCAVSHEPPTHELTAGERMRESDAAAYIGVAPKTLANWRSAGKGPRYCKLGRMIVYQRGDLDAYFEDHMHAPAG